MPDTIHDLLAGLNRLEGKVDILLADRPQCFSRFSALEAGQARLNKSRNIVYGAGTSIFVLLLWLMEKPWLKQLLSLN